MSLKQQAELLALNRTGLYYRPVPASPAEVRLKHRIDEIYTAHPFYGSRRITAVLNREMSVNRQAVQRHMREMGIAGICPGPSLSKRCAEHQVYPYLLRNLRITYPNHVWGIDITYIRLIGGWLYLVAILDWPKVSLCGELGVGSNAGSGLCHGGGGQRAGAGQAHHLQ